MSQQIPEKFQKSIQTVLEYEQDLFHTCKIAITQSETAEITVKFVICSVAEFCCGPSLKAAEHRLASDFLRRSAEAEHQREVVLLQRRSDSPH